MPYLPILPPLLILFALAGTLPAQDSQSTVSKHHSIDDLSWLAGSWSGTTGERETEEHWIEPKGKLMLGVNRTVTAAGKSTFEFLRIAQHDKGITLFASPSGGPATAFQLVELSGDKVVFSNPSHDFPQQISYRLEDGRLHARVEGRVNGEMQSIQWTWQRVK